MQLLGRLNFESVSIFQMRDFRVHRPSMQFCGAGVCFTGTSMGKLEFALRGLDTVFLD